MRSFVIAIVAAAIGVVTVMIAVSRGAEPTKTLEEIEIEGELRLPEVLFITTRDVARPLDWIDAYLTRQQDELARLDAMPVRLRVAGDGDDVTAPREAPDIRDDPTFPESVTQEETR